MSEGIVYGDYFLLGRLNTGGMAEVFLGKRLGDGVGGPLLAVKRMLTQFSDDSHVVQMFEDEARIAKRLHHPNICEVYDEGAHNNQLYLVMEFIHGKDLRVVSQRARKAGERVSYAVTAFVAAAIADALDYAHAMKGADGEPEPIIHRDISPQNILVSYDGVPKLIDFGIAKAKNRVVETRVGIVKGKYGYMSPEQATGGKLDARSDVFSLGVVLYELATGIQPFRAASDVSTLRKVAKAAAAPASVVNAALPPTLSAIIDKALQRDPAKRHESAAAMAAKLREFIREDGRPITTESLSRTMREMFRDDFQREHQRIEHYQAVVTPDKPTAMVDTHEEIEHSRTSVSPIVASDTMLAAGYGADEEQTSTDYPPKDWDFDDEDMLRLIGDDENGSLEQTIDDEPTSAQPPPDPFAITTPVSAITSTVVAPASSPRAPVDDEHAGRMPAPVDDELTTGDDNPWSGADARTRTFEPISRSVSATEPTRSFIPIPEGPTAVARPAPIFQEKTRVVANLAKHVAPSSFGQEVTKQEHPPRDETAQLSEVLGALSPFATATSVTPAPMFERPEKALTKVAPAPKPPKKRRGPAPLVDDEPTDARDVEEQTRDEPTHNDIARDAVRPDNHRDTYTESSKADEDERPNTRDDDFSPRDSFAPDDEDDDYVPMFTRSDAVTLLIAAMMGFLIMTASYLYALNVQLPDPDPIVEQSNH